MKKPYIVGLGKHVLCAELGGSSYPRAVLYYSDGEDHNYRLDIVNGLLTFVDGVSTSASTPNQRRLWMDKVNLFGKVKDIGKLKDSLRKELESVNSREARTLLKHLGRWVGYVEPQTNFTISTNKPVLTAFEELEM